MSLYVSEKVGNEIVLKKYAPAVPVYRGFWAVTIGGFAGTLVECNGSMRYIGSNEKTIYQIVEPGTYTFTATRHGETKSKTIVLDDKDPNNSYTVNLGLYIGMQYLEYIESTGTQYIDTGIIPTETTVIDIVIGRNTSTEINSNGLFGNDNVGARWNGLNEFRSGFGTSSWTSVTVSQQDKNHIIYEKTNPTFNGTSISISRGTAYGEETLYLYRTTSSYSSTKIYSCKIYDNDVLVRDFVPIKDDTNHGAMYDKVTQQIFYNSGEGEFICGPNKPYKRIQYLESTGTQSIDTGICVEPNFKLEIKYLVNEIPTTMFNAPYGNSDGNDEHPNLRHLYSNGYLNGNLLINTDQSGEYPQGPQLSVNTVYTEEVDPTKWVINGTTYTNTLSRTLVTSNTLKIFDRDETTTNRGMKGRIYSFKLSNNGTLVRDMIPILDNEDVPCMYDQVNDRLYYNDGTGEFISGPSRVELEYVEATGTQWVNTGIIPTRDTRVKVKAKFNTVGFTDWDNIVGSKANAQTTETRFYPFGTNRSTSKFRFTYGTNQIELNWDTNIHTVDFNDTMRRVIFDDVVIGTLSNSTYDPSNAIEMTLFVYNLPSGVDLTSLSKSRIYEYEVYQGGQLVQKLVPSINYDGSVGFYDEVSEQFLTSASGTELIPGPEK